VGSLLGRRRRRRSRSRRKRGRRRGNVGSIAIAAGFRYYHSGGKMKRRRPPPRSRKEIRESSRRPIWRAATAMTITTTTKMRPSFLPGLQVSCRSSQIPRGVPEVAGAVIG
jgi:hypothetical protein